MSFKLTRDFIDNIRQAVRQGDVHTIESILVELHSADIAEIFESIDAHESKFILDLLEEELAAEVLTELEEDARERLLKIMSSKEIA